MSRKHNKSTSFRLPGFTLMETLVGMALMGILCASGYYAMELVQKHYQLFQKNNNAMYSFQHLAHRLQSDIDKARLVERTDNILICQNDLYAVHYIFEEEMVSRYSSPYPEIRDTFPIITKKLHSFFEENSVNVGIVDQVEIELAQFEREERLLLFKSYTSAQLMQIKLL